MPTVILVEDDYDLKESYVECLRLNDFDTTGVGSAIECYRALDQRPYDIAIVDIGLPDQNGFIVAEFIRQNTQMGVIILTAMGEPEDRAKGYDCGADIYFTKPVKCMELAAAVRSLYNRMKDTKTATAFSQRNPNAWVFNPLANELTPPGHEAVRLTDKEGAFMQLICDAPEQKATREYLLEGLDYEFSDLGDRALNALVLRLRKKIDAAVEEKSPLRTAHAIGFYFAEPLVTD